MYIRYLSSELKVSMVDHRLAISSSSSFMSLLYENKKKGADIYRTQICGGQKMKREISRDSEMGQRTHIKGKQEGMECIPSSAVRQLELWYAQGLAGRPHLY